MSPEFQNLLRDLLGTASKVRKREQILRALAFSDMYGRFEDVEPAHFETFKWIFDEAYEDHVDDDAKPVGEFSNRWKYPELDDDLEVEDDDLDAEDDNSEVKGDDLEAEDDNSDSEGDNNSTLNPLDSGEDTKSEADEKTGFGDIKHDYSVRQPFLHWLLAGNGIFHISGKLGSGKSTLMKFLCDHRRTTTELQKWAGTYFILD
jgi:hypothetical protein